MSLNALKQLNMDRVLDMEEAVSLSAYARTLANEYDELGQVAPDWLGKSTTTLREEIARRTRAADFAKLKDLEVELEGYKTVSERKTDALRRLTDLQRKLGIGGTAAKAAK